MHTSNQHQCWLERDADATRFEQVCIYISGLTQTTVKETISVAKGKESHKGTCPVPYCHVCGKQAGQKWEYEKGLWCCKCLLAAHGLLHERKNVRIHRKYRQEAYSIANPRRLFIIQTWTILSSLKRNSPKRECWHMTLFMRHVLSAFQEMILYQRRAYFDALHDRYNADALALEPGVKLTFVILACR